jgi:TolB-like protein
MPNKLSQFWQELKRRNVTRVLAVYIAAAFMILELINMFSESLGLPERTLLVAFFISIAGLVITVIVSWVYDIQPEVGIVKTEAADKMKTEDLMKSSNSWKIASYISFVVIVGLIVLNVISRTGKKEILEKSIAVLPFHNYSGDVNQEHICDGMTLEVINNLYKIQSFDRVSSLASVLRYKDTKIELTQIAEELNVNYILQCSYLKVDEQLSRFSIQLVEPKSDKYIWHDNFDQDSEEISTVPSSIALQIAKQLNAFITNSEMLLIQNITTKNKEAYHKYQIGNHYYYGKGFADYLDRAIGFYSESIELDSTFSLGYIQLAKCYLLKHWYRYDMSDSSLIKSEKAIAVAMEIDPELPELSTVQGAYYYWGYRDYENALIHLNRAEKLMPNDAEIKYYQALIYRRMGDWERAIKAFEYAHESDPGFVDIIFNLSETYFMIGSFEETLSYLDKGSLIIPENIRIPDQKIHLYLMKDGNTTKAREVQYKASTIGVTEEILNERSFWTPPLVLDIYDGNYNKALEYILSSGWEGRITPFTFHPKSLYCAHIYDLMDQKEDANIFFDSTRIILEQMVIEFPNDPRIHSAIGITYAGLGDKEKAIRFGKNAVEMMSLSKDAFQGMNRIAELAWIFVMLEEYELALEQIEIMLSKPGQFSAPLLKLDPKWKPLWDHPNFIKLTEKYSQKGINNYDS